MLRDLWLIAKQTYVGYIRSASTQQAAAITYYLLFSLVPLAIVVFAVLGIFLSGEEVRDEIVDWILDIVPLSETDGRDAVVGAVESIQNISTTFALVGLALSLWSSMAVFSSIRRALNNVWRMNEDRPFVQSKIIDLVQVGLVLVVLLGSIVLASAIRILSEKGSQYLGPLTPESLIWQIPTALVPGALSFLAFAVLYKVVPAAHPQWRAVLPGSLAATVLFLVLINTFAFYAANFGSYNVVYGSIAGIMLVLGLAFLSSSVLLIGAELVKAIEMHRAGTLRAQANEAPQTEPQPLADRAWRSLRGMFVKD